ncbi:hypothetical protein K4E_16180 [Enterococcus thailandicus]|nr:hypothetical protein K4E_16180 [Enterococcus thailandicus]
MVKYDYEFKRIVVEAYQNGRYLKNLIMPQKYRDRETDGT